MVVEEKRKGKVEKEEKLIKTHTPELWRKGRKRLPERNNQEYEGMWLILLLTGSSFSLDRRQPHWQAQGSWKCHAILICAAASVS